MIALQVNWSRKLLAAVDSSTRDARDFLGPWADPASVLRLQLQPTAQGLFLDWNTQPHLIYQVQVSTNLRSWTNLGGLRFAPGTVDSMYLGSSPASYYRVLRVR